MIRRYNTFTNLWDELEEATPSFSFSYLPFIQEKKLIRRVLDTLKQTSN